MTAQSSLRHYTRIVQHFTSTRSMEVFALQASPILGCVLGGFIIGRRGMIQAGLLLLGSLTLTAHIFVFNDWAGYNSDNQDPRRATHVSARQGISRHEIACFALILLSFAIIILAIVSSLALLLGTAIVVLSFLYSGSEKFGKNAPIIGSLNHLLGGILHFLLGYTYIHPLDTKGLMMSLFFGLVFAGGHLNQEVRDYEGDTLNKIRTSAVVFGRQQTFIASLCTFTVAYAIITVLAALDILPRLLVWSPVIWILHLIWSLQALRCGLGFDTAIWMQRRYRVLFAIIGLALLTR